MGKWILLVIGIALVAGKGAVTVGLARVIEVMAQAIKEFEGWYAGSRSYRNNNPGNLKFAGQAGAIGQDDEGHAIFSSYSAGWNALKNQIRAAFNGTSRVYSAADSLYSFFRKYAEGNATQYAEFVAGKLGVDPNSTLGGLIS